MPVVPWEPPPARRGADQLPNFYHAVLTFERLNVCSIGFNVTKTKKVVKMSTFFWGGEKSAPEEKIQGTRMRKGQIASTRPVLYRFRISREDQAGKRQTGEA